jgi:hypothetical protein
VAPGTGVGDSLDTGEPVGADEPVGLGEPDGTALGLTATLTGAISTGVPAVSPIADIVEKPTTTAAAASATRTTTTPASHSDRPPSAGVPVPLEE